MRHLRLLSLLAWLLIPAASGAQPAPTPNEFVPMAEVPPEEQIPAITLVASAYGLVWLALFGYVWSLGRRLGRAESDLHRLERKEP